MPNPKPEPVADTERNAAVEAAVEKARASLDAGRSLPYATVREWLLSWGRAQESLAPIRHGAQHRTP
jgi:predicted transcriptional regulator